MTQKEIFVGGDVNGRKKGGVEVKDRLTEKVEYKYLRIVEEEWLQLSDKKGWLEEILTSL